MGYYVPHEGYEQMYDWDHCPCIIDRGADGVYAIPHVVAGVQGVKISQYRSGAVLQCDEHRLPCGWSLGDPIAGGGPCTQFHDKIEHEMGASMNVAAARITNSWVQSTCPHLHQQPAHHYRCLYTTPTPDGKFVMGRHPEDPNVFVACAGCGEGFRFGMVL